MKHYDLKQKHTQIKHTSWEIYNLHILENQPYSLS